MTGPRIGLAVLRKDLRLDFRSRDRIGHMLVFAALVVVLLSITLQDARPRSPAWLPSLLWVVLMFTSLLGLSRSFQAETEDGAIVSLVQVPCDRGWVFLGKTAANWIALVGVAAWGALLFAIFLEAPWAAAPGTLVGAGLLGTLGISIVGTLLSAMATSARFREFLLPLLLFPFLLPVLVFSARIVADAIDGGSPPGLWWGALALYDWVFLLVGYFSFDYLLDE